MATEKQFYDAIQWAKNKAFVDEITGESRFIDLQNPNEVVDTVREYFNNNNIEQPPMIFEDIEPYL